jgi:hypothetical protein
MGCGQAALILLTSRRLIEIRPGWRHSVALSGELYPPRVLAALHATPDQLFVGFNDGEWGGGLRRIERATGRFETIGKGDCGDLLDPHCRPVHGMETLPWKPDCILAAVGLVHFLPEGHLVRVCGTKVTLAYSKAIESGFEREGQSPNGSVAFFGLARQGDVLWAAGVNGLYRVRAVGPVDMVPMPRFKPVGNFHVSFDVPGIVLLVTQINRRASVSSGAPMIVAR